MSDYITKFNGAVNDNAFAKVANELCKELSMLFAVRGIEPEDTTVSSSDGKATLSFKWGKFGKPVIGHHGLNIDYCAESLMLRFDCLWPRYKDHQGNVRQFSPSDWNVSQLENDEDNEPSPAQSLLDRKTVNKWMKNNSFNLPVSLLTSPEKLIKRLERELDVYQAFTDTVVPFTEKWIAGTQKIIEAVNTRDKWMENFKPHTDHNYYRSWYYHSTKGIESYVEFDNGWACHDGKGETEEELEVRFTFKDKSISREKFAAIVSEMAGIVNKSV